MSTGSPALQPPSGWSARIVPLARLPELAMLALGDEPPERLGVVLTILKDALQNNADGLLMAEAVGPNNEASMAGVVLRSSHDAATLLAFGPAQSLAAKANSAPTSMPPDRAAAARLILDVLHGQLMKGGTRFVQAMRPPDRPQPELEHNGYLPLATLDYLVAQRPFVHEPRRSHSTLRFVPYRGWFTTNTAHDADSRMVALVDATYVDSMDCPAIASLRSTCDVLESYRQSPGFRPDCWQILVESSNTEVGDREVGCLLMSPHEASGSLEVTYMGLVPEFRRVRYGDRILAQAWRTAHQEGLLQLTLAVDRNNLPANRLYRRHDFEVMLSEAVWGCRLKKSF